MGDAQEAERARPLSYAASAILFLTLVLGGATHGDAITSLLARLMGIGLLCYCVWTLPSQRPSLAERLGLGLLGVIAMVVLAQLVPLPPSIWTHLPGREFLVANLRASGQSLGSLPLSLSPDSTWNVLPGLAVPAGMFLATCRANAAGRRILVLAILAGGAVSLCLGGLQLMQGQDSPLRFYSVTNIDSGVGFFANRNHQAALLVAAIPLTIYWAMRWAKRGGASGLASTALALGVILLWVVGLGITLSRAGVILGAAAVVGGLVMVLRSRAYPGRTILALGLLGSVLLGSALIYVFAFSSLSGRFSAPLSAENRIETAPAIIATAKAFSPVGAGFGAFVPAYQRYEPPAAISNQYLNHAHDEYLELWIETGWAGLVVLAFGLTWIIWRTGEAWLTATPEGDLARAGSLIVLALLAHSALDYPLRTAAMSAVFGLACGLMTPVQSSPAGRKKRRGGEALALDAQMSSI